jgi:hypothetical protein
MPGYAESWSCRKVNYGSTGKSKPVSEETREKMRVIKTKYWEEKRRSCKSAEQV